jgi:oligopeptide/dipeptide ABC transporter ATP-binding protein
MEKVGLSEPKRCLSAYPHEFSGGMQQRAMIAMALACHPRLLVADEPTSALDVTIQAQILDLLARLRDELQMAILLISHDLAVVAGMAHRVYVMYAGRILESGSARQVLASPAHPYTKGLLDAVPRLSHRPDRMRAMPGTVPRLGRLPRGCTFAPRCPLAEDACRIEEPVLRSASDGRTVRCRLCGA